MKLKARTGVRTPGKHSLNWVTICDLQERCSCRDFHWVGFRSCSGSGVHVRLISSQGKSDGEVILIISLTHQNQKAEPYTQTKYVSAKRQRSTPTVRLPWVAHQGLPYRLAGWLWMITGKFHLFSTALSVHLFRWVTNEGKGHHLTPFTSDYGVCGLCHFPTAH